ncbi:hypothetical protein [Leptolyngbya sp. NIES-2104]|nr:hypothetical protein [Leptolyngbya sp. NIES-2104]
MFRTINYYRTGMKQYEQLRYTEGSAVICQLFDRNGQPLQPR